MQVSAAVVDARNYSPRGRVRGEPALLEQLALWAEAGDNHRIRQQLRMLEAEHARLYQDHRAMPTEVMRARRLGEIEQKEREIGELKGT